MSKKIIYLDDAIDALKRLQKDISGDYTDLDPMVMAGCGYIGDCIGEIQDLPSAQPEVIRCTECKHYREYDSEYVENAVVVRCMADRYPISETIPDGWFCAGAERKDDE